MFMKDNRAITVLVGIATLAFGWVIYPFLGAVFWAVVIAIVFYPLYKWILARLSGRANFASFVTLSLVFLIVIIPLLLVFLAVIREASTLITTIQADEASLQNLFESVFGLLPKLLISMLSGIGITDFEGFQTRAAAEVSGWIGAIAPQVLQLGQSTANFLINLFVMLYLTFFLFRDGEKLLANVKSALPLRPETQDMLFARFGLVVRATVRGDILVAMLQGGLGGIGFWVLGIPAAILWTVLMSFLALLPVLGAALVWIPFAIYLLSTGEVVQGFGLMAYGLLVISVVDNFVRPLLIGKVTKIPEFIVLISTLGGVAAFGLQGFITGPVVAAMFISAWMTFLASDDA